MVEGQEMNEERFKHLIDSYGADPGRWPADESAAATAFLASSDKAQRWLAQARAIDQVLERIDSGVDAQLLSNITSGIEARFQQANQSGLDRMIKWLLPDMAFLPSTIWRPTMAACLPLILGISIGLNISTDEATLSSSEEIALLAISPTTTEIWLYE